MINTLSGLYNQQPATKRYSQPNQQAGAQPYMQPVKQPPRLQGNQQPQAMPPQPMQQPNPMVNRGQLASNALGQMAQARPLGQDMQLQPMQPLQQGVNYGY